MFLLLKEDHEQKNVIMEHLVMNMDFVLMEQFLIQKNQDHVIMKQFQNGQLF